MTNNQIIQLIKDGYKQTSRKYKDVARIPEGLTGKQSLFLAKKKEYSQTQWVDFWEEETKRWIDCLGEIEAGNFFRRMYGPHIQLSDIDFKQFKILGGQSA